MSKTLIENLTILKDNGSIDITDVFYTGRIEHNKVLNVEIYVQPKDKEKKQKFIEKVANIAIYLKQKYKGRVTINIKENTYFVFKAQKLNFHDYMIVNAFACEYKKEVGLIKK